MQAIISPGKVKGTIHVPASKSMMQRVCAAALLHTGKTIISNPGHSADDEAVLKIIEQLGAKILRREECIEIESNGIGQVPGKIDCGESGLAARLFIPIVAMTNQSITVIGNGSLLQRPMNLHAATLSRLGVNIVDNGGYLPFNITGPLLLNDITIDASGSSQFLSGLLFAFAFAAKSPVSINVVNLESKPYIDLTLEVLAKFGKYITHHNYEVFYIDPAAFKVVGDLNIFIEGDWSSAAGLLVLGSINGDLTLSGLKMDSVQADKAILDVLKNAGADIVTTHDSIHVKESLLSAFEFDATDCPDLFPVLSVLAACAKGESFITGIHRLIHKESNRIESIADMMSQLGVFFSIEDDTLVIAGAEELEVATIDTYNDHRMVMAATIAGLKSRGHVIVNDIEAVNKSYPSFFSDLSSLGANCTFNN